jgi:hypothetical protein
VLVALHVNVGAGPLTVPASLCTLILSTAGMPPLAADASVVVIVAAAGARALQ